MQLLCFFKSNLHHLNISFVSGVLWNGGDVIKDANAVVNKLQELGKKVFLVTNNSTKSRDEYVAKCAKLGFNCNEVRFKVE